MRKPAMGHFLFWLVCDKLNKNSPAEGGFLISYKGIRSPNLIENWFNADPQFLIGIVHFFAMLSSAK